jgi:hypothetical protein
MVVLYTNFNIRVVSLLPWCWGPSSFEGPKKHD